MRLIALAVSIFSLLRVAPMLRAAEREDRNLLAGGTLSLSMPHPGDAETTSVPTAGVPGAGAALRIAVRTAANKGTRRRYPPR